MTDFQSHLPDPTLDAQFYEGVPLKRLIAWFIDVFIVLSIIVACIILTLGMLAFVFPFLAFCINLAYRIFCLNKWSATLGMRLTGIEIRNAKGERLTLAESAWHTGVFVCVFVSLLGIVANMIAMFLSERGQGIHDLLLGTVAINRPAD
jgi:uncharacterized RDD family membrane protein YckC